MWPLKLNRSISDLARIRLPKKNRAAVLAVTFAGMTILDRLPGVAMACYTLVKTELAPT